MANCPVCKGKDVSFFCENYKLFYPKIDKDGRKHYHDSDGIEYIYYCDKGHKWRVVHRGSCWCGWDGNEPYGGPVEVVL